MSIKKEKNQKLRNLKNQKLRKIDVLLEKLERGDRLLVAELSRLGRNMLETLNIINTLTEKDLRLVKNKKEGRITTVN